LEFGNAAAISPGSTYHGNTTSTPKHDPDKNSHTDRYIGAFTYTSTNIHRLTVTNAASANEHTITYTYSVTDVHTADDHSYI
jgi:hypothetical protein